jgi:hypothetical protein
MPAHEDNGFQIIYVIGKVTRPWEEVRTKFPPRLSPLIYEPGDPLPVSQANKFTSPVKSQRIAADSHCNP